MKNNFSISIFYIGPSSGGLHSAVRFALPELELGTVVEEEPEDLDCRGQKEKYQAKYKKISWISRKMNKVDTIRS